MNSTLDRRGRELAEALGGRWSRGRGMGRCPAHDDRTPSLGLRLGSRAILLHCFAGCPTADVLAALARSGIPTRNLFDGSAKKICPIPAPDGPDANAVRLWRKAAPLSGTVADTYLGSRAIDCRSTELRYLEKTPLGPRGRASFQPALVAALRTDAGVIAIQRTFLTPAATLGDMESPKRGLGRYGVASVIPRLEQAWFMTARPVANEDTADDAVAVVESHDTDDTKRATLSQKLIDELAMQRRDILALHLANDPALALDVAVFSIADDSRAGRSEPSGTTLRGTAASGPVHGFEATDAPATAAFAEARNGLDISWCAGDTRVERFVAFRELPDEARAAWLGMVVARTLEASLNIGQAFGSRGCAFHDLLGSLLGIDVAAWWRPTAANFFDRVSKATILDALSQVGGPELASRYAGSKKAELAAAAERIFSGNFIAEIETKQAAIAWVPDVMRFAHQRDENGAGEPAAEDATPSVANHDDEPQTGLAA